MADRRPIERARNSEVSVRSPGRRDFEYEARRDCHASRSIASTPPVIRGGHRRNRRRCGAGQGAAAGCQSIATRPAAGSVLGPARRGARIAAADQPGARPFRAGADNAAALLGARQARQPRGREHSADRTTTDSDAGRQAARRHPKTAQRLQSGGLFRRADQCAVIAGRRQRQRLCQHASEMAKELSDNDLQATADSSPSNRRPDRRPMPATRRVSNAVGR